MSIPHIDLNEPQHRILAELMVGDLPRSHDVQMSAEVRGLSPHTLAVEVPVLKWLKLIDDRDNVLSVTTLGAAIFHRAKQEEAETLLAAVVSFADVLEAAVGSKDALRRAPHALRQLAQGIISRDQAVRRLLA